MGRYNFKPPLPLRLYRLCGTLLLRRLHFAENEALKQGYTDQNLYTHESMTENIGLYEYLGYIEADRKRLSPSVYEKEPGLRVRPG